GLDHGAVHDAGLHTDEAAILERTGMQQRHVAHRHVGADGAGEAALAASAVLLLVDVDDRAVLDVGARADADSVAVAAQHAAEPDAALGADVDIADHHCRRRNEGAGGDARLEIVERQDQAAHGNSGSCSSPVVSGRPAIRFMFCTACPEAPFTRLSITDSRIARPGTRSAKIPIRPWLAPRPWRVS